VARLSGAANITLDFLDRRHLLVTFNPRKLIARLPECPTTHADRLVHAVVLEMPTGRVVKEADWYLHDSRRYLWTLGSGRFLLRKLNKLYEVDSDLEEKLIFDSPKDLVWVSVTPDGGQIIAEELEKGASTTDDVKDRGRVKISFLATNSLDVQKVIGSSKAIQMEATTAGFSDVRKSGDTWLVRFGAAARDRTNITRVRTRKSPSVLYSSSATLVVGRCSFPEDRYSVSAFTLAGMFLWRQRWDRCRYSPVVRRSEEGGRFAVGTVIPLGNQEEHPTDGQDPDAEQDGLEQRVEVFDTMSGKSLFSLRATPPVLDGENFALSSDGQQFVILTDSTIALYSLPETSSEERANLAALKGDLDLQMPPTRAGSAATQSEAIRSRLKGNRGRWWLCPAPVLRIRPSPSHR
jgi:hypothetical protein